MYKTKEFAMIKDMLYTTLGAGILAKEKITQELEKMHEKGEESRKKAKELQKQLEEKGKAQEVQLKEEIRKLIKEVIDEMGLVTKDDLNSTKK
jgi:polyhydroxyalkanoate synthesis regulator phasin